jgi:predicted DsbA family dithiol-disulfide isomerase
MSFLDVWKNISGRNLLIYADFIDPFCYIGFHILKPLAEARRIQLEWRGFELNPDTPPEGLSLETAANSDLRPGMWASVAGLAQSAGLSFPEPRRAPNTRSAHALLELAQKPDVKNPLIERIYQAYFRGQKNIGQLDVLIDLAKDFGIPADRVRAALADPGLTKALEQRRAEAQKRQFLGMPGFVYKGRTYFGALSKQAWQAIFEGGLHRAVR